MTLKEVFANANRTLESDNRSYFVRSINAVLATGLVSLSLAPAGKVWNNIANPKFNVEVKAAGIVARNYYKNIEPEDLLRLIGELLQHEIVKQRISSTVILQDNRCDKCGGKGIIPAFRHIAKGVCFDCLGLGVNVRASNDLVKIKA